MTEEKIQVDVVGALLELLTVEYDPLTGVETTVDISGATSKSIVVQRPDNSSFSRTAVFSSDGTDGKIHIVTEAGDISMDGTYYIQSDIALPGRSGHSTIGSFEAVANLG